MNQASQPGSDLLRKLDRKLRDDPQPPGLTGRVAIGVRGQDGTTAWLVAACDEQVRTEWTSDYPTFDAALGLDDAAAREVMAGELPSEGNLCIKTGDDALLGSFLTRYFGTAPGTMSLLNLRLGGG